MNIYLVVLESDKTSITTATFDHFLAHKLCHLYTNGTFCRHAVVTEEITSISPRIIVSLLKQSRFAKEYLKMFGYASN